MKLFRIGVIVMHEQVSAKDTNYVYATIRFIKAPVIAIHIYYNFLLGWNRGIVSHESVDVHHVEMHPHQCQPFVSIIILDSKKGQGTSPTYLFVY